MSIMKRHLYLILALLALVAGQAQAQRRLPGMKEIRFLAEMADGFYSGANRHDAGYAFSLAVSSYTQKGTSGCWEVRSYDGIPLTGTDMSRWPNIRGKADITTRFSPRRTRRCS